MNFDRWTCFSALILAALLFPAAGVAKMGSNQICPYPAAPPYADVDAAPNLLVWREGDAPGPLNPAGCSLWGAWHSSLLVALAGRFSFSGDGTELARRFGAISTLRGIKYWSVTDARWQTLILDASAVVGAGQQRRGDFSLAEIPSGQDLYFEQQDNSSP
jgi:hypothetical protein